jgi:NADH-quinone oxidoreductase subunit D
VDDVAFLQSGLTSPLKKWGTKWSLWPVHLVTACCGVELAHAYACGYDAERLGSLNYGICRQTNFIIVEGAITRKMARVLRMTWEQMPNPKFVVVMGTCGIKGGIFWNSYHMVRPWEVVPVKYFVPGCPPTPEALIKSIVALQKEIEGKKLKVEFEKFNVEDGNGRVRRFPPLRKFVVDHPAVVLNVEKGVGNEEIRREIEDVLGTKVYAVGDNVFFAFVDDILKSADGLDRLGFGQVLSVNVIDVPHEDCFIVEYHLTKYEAKENVIVIIAKKINRNDPRIPSLSKIFPSADYMEREMHEFFGVVFEGNDGMGRNFLLDVSTPKYPLRKDFKIEEESITEQKKCLQDFDGDLSVTKLSDDFVSKAISEEEFVLVVGPQHPGSGHMRLIVKLDGDVIREVIPDPGYVHRGVEKIAENRLYIQNIPLVERPSIIDFANYDLCYVQAIEKALDMDVPERANYIRTILAELCRIGTHLYDAGILAVFLGHTTGFMWAFGLREFICEALALMTGARVTGSFIVPGGIRRDVNDDVLKKVKKIVLSMRGRLSRFEKVFVKNPTVVARLKDVGVLRKWDALKYGLVGPFLRASGSKFDVRVKRPYGAYKEVDWEVVTGIDGDAYTRLLVRVEEVNQSIDIVTQLIDNIPSGEIKTDLWKLSDLVLPMGEHLSLVECARGTLFMSMVSDGESNVPYRFRIVTPCWYILKGFMEACKGYRLADLQAIYGSFGYFPPEADR